jgi:hypothetical protein
MAASLSSTSSTFSGLTAPTVATAPAGASSGFLATKPKGEDTRVKNPDFNGELFGIYKTSA